MSHLSSSQFKTLAIVTGANGAIGRAYLNSLRLRDDTRCIAISRNLQGVGMNSVEDLYIADLTDAQETTQAMSRVALASFDRILFIHTVGKFKFELPTSDTTLDAEVLTSNIDSFVNTVAPLLEQIKQLQTHGREVPVVLCALGSISDKCHPPLWRSYSAAKNQLRVLMQAHVSADPNFPIATVFVNVSTVDTGAEQQLRPSARPEEKIDWLTPTEVVERSLPHLLYAFSGPHTPEAPRYQELEIFKPSSNYREGHYTVEQALPRWQQAMGRRK